MIHALELTGRQVLTIDEGAAAGKVSGVLINSITGEVAALVVALNDRFESPRAVPVSLVQGVGDDAVVIENSSALIEFGQSPELKAMGRLDSQIRGLPVITVVGKALGRVADLVINMDTGRVEAFDVEPEPGAAHGLLEAKSVATIGRDAIIATTHATLATSQGGGGDRA
ncbi:MAG: PRC-barrel domain protein [Firmicutes bacterium ADurb.Bin506]|jgi:uncharacterized protein YrrD|nr:MAG: PRC-barrel domain protein [Firmicutes bacterium ADurb.Bin506]